MGAVTAVAQFFYLNYRKITIDPIDKRDSILSKARVEKI